MLVQINDLVPGMVLGEDIILPNGATLLNSSTVLSEHTIEQIRKYHIKEIQIAEEDTTEEQAQEEDQGDNDKETSETLVREESPQEANEEQDKKEESEKDKEVEAPAESYTLPKITVVIENDAFSALMRIEPASGENERLTVPDLKEVLQEHNIVYGINEQLLVDIVKQWEESPELIECENVAQGTPPTPAKEGTLDIVVEYIKNSRDLKKAKSAEYSWELIDASIPLQRVDPGSTVGKKELQIPEIPGLNIHGDEIAAKEKIKTEVKTGENIEEDEENNVYTSTVTGIAYFVEDTLGVIPINFDGTAEIEISPDNMQATLIIHPPGEGGEAPAEQAIRELIQQESIVYGIKEKILTKVFTDLKNNVYSEKPIIIAEGLPPENGKEGKVKYLFKTDLSLTPETDEKGNVDYKKVSLIQSVVKGQRIAKLIPPTDGTPGKDIRGNNLPCTAGNPAVLPAGPNTKIKEDDENTLVAEIAGNVRINNQVIEVWEGFTIQGDVDYSTGNIEYDKSVIINGDIKSGFSVQCGGDCEISGTIEDAHVQVGGHLVGKLGFNGHGKGIIECHGDVSLMFVSNQTIRSQGSIHIAKEAINSTMFARGAITVSGTSLSVAGGRLVARDGITCHVVGNENGIHTLLETGVDFHLAESLDAEEKKLQDIHDNRDKLLYAFKKLDSAIKIGKKLPQKEQLVYTRLKNSISDFENEMQIIEKKIALLSEKIAQVGNPFIKIEHAVLPGTVLRIGNENLVVQKEIIGPKMIRLVNGEMRIL